MFIPDGRIDLDQRCFELLELLELLLLELLLLEFLLLELLDRCYFELLLTAV
jgi:hypothetical protein